MTVKELIAELQKLPQDLPVCVMRLYAESDQPVFHEPTLEQMTGEYREGEKMVHGTMVGIL